MRILIGLGCVGVLIPIYFGVLVPACWLRHVSRKLSQRL